MQLSERTKALVLEAAAALYNDAQHAEANAGSTEQMLNAQAMFAASKDLRTLAGEMR